MALWDGRFEGGPSAEMQAFSESLDTDMLMWREDIAGSMAHVTMLGEVGLLTNEEAATIRSLAKVEADLEVGHSPTSLSKTSTWPWRPSWGSTSARSRASCILPALATTKWPPMCACGSGAASTS